MLTATVAKCLLLSFFALAADVPQRPQETEDQKAFAAALRMRRSERAAALETGLRAYLDRYETEYSAQEAGFRFREKPNEINPGLLRAVVFVQDDETMQVMQTGYID